MLHKLLTAFVVDDEDIIASTRRLILSNQGFYARSFIDPLEALKAAAQSVSPDLLLTDVMMPGINGIELAKQVKARCPKCKILLFSGQSETVDLLEDAGAQGDYFEILSKPVHPRDLLAKIEKLFESSSAA
jgi:CheY-like chemotaxis protein